MRAYQMGIVVILISYNFLVGAVYADYETAKLFAGENKYTQAYEACWNDAQNGVADCQNYIGFAYSTGRGVLQNSKEGVKWYLLAANQGNAKAQANLGNRYLNGKGVPKNLKEAMKWYQLAANQGHKGGQQGVGICYLRGQGVAQNDKEAVKWFQLSADQGNRWAQDALGFCYEEGRGVAQNDKTALKWYQLAADQGIKRAIEKVEYLSKKEASEIIARSLKDISEEKILGDIAGKTIENWKIKKEYKNIIRILNSNNNNNNPKFTIAVFSSEKQSGSNIQGFFCKLEIEYKKIAGELFLVNTRTIESELGKKHKTLAKYYGNFYPLCSAVKENNEGLVKELLRKGADINEIDNYYWTPLVHAYTNKFKDIEELLISKGADIHLVGANMLSISLRNNDFTSAKELLDRGVDINSKPKTGSRYAESAIESSVGNEAAFNFLVENGANIGIKNYYGGTLLHEAVDCSSGNLNVAKYLIKKGLDVNAIASNGRTPLINACGCSACKPEYIQLLLGNGADIHIKAGYQLSNGRDWQGTAYDWAKSSGCIENIKPLIHRLH